MMKSAFLATLLLSLISFSAHAETKIVQAMNVPHRGGTFVRINPSAVNLNAGLFDQKTDHFNANDSRTFKQRYFVNSSFSNGPQSPVIYYICGEGSCEGPGGAAVNALAKRIQATMIALEHRYYGTSQPFATLAAENLQYLSMDQAIEDLAAFQRYAQQALGLQGKWISIGGSYSGSLSAFYRLKHPELVVGSLASSAPVFSNANFFEYDRHVARVAGPECLAAIKSVVSDVENKLKDPASNAQVKALFSASELRDDVDFLYVIADMAAFAVQYGYQNKFCSALVDGMHTGKATEAYAQIGVEILSAFGITPLQDSFQGAESIDPNDYLSFAGMRGWMYQSCKEFGFYQVANSNIAESARSQLITLDFHNRICDKLFGIKTQVNDRATNLKYYEPLFSPSTTHIYFTNGSNDPWSNLSITPSNPRATANPGIQFFLIGGSAHCDDLGSRVSTALNQARDQFSMLVDQWIK